MVEYGNVRQLHELHLGVPDGEQLNVGKCCLRMHIISRFFSMQIVTACRCHH